MGLPPSQVDLGLCRRKLSRGCEKAVALRQSVTVTQYSPGSHVNHLTAFLAMWWQCAIVNHEEQLHPIADYRHLAMVCRRLLGNCHHWNLKMVLSENVWWHFSRQDGGNVPAQWNVPLNAAAQKYVRSCS